MAGFMQMARQVYAPNNSFKPRPLRGSAAWRRVPLRRSAQRSGLTQALGGMNQHLHRLILDYQASVRTAVELMRQSGIPLPATNTDWVGTGIPPRGELDGGIAYFKHGYGCAVKLPAGEVDFDFGEHGEIDGFDAWRLTRFAGPRLPSYGFSDAAALNECFKAEVAAGSVVFSGYILHYITDAG